MSTKNQNDHNVTNNSDEQNEDAGIEFICNGCIKQ